jgi:hydrogenase maturation protease
MQKTLILGLGNVLLNDEGIGVHSVNRMTAMEWPEGVDLLDGGTGGFMLLSLFQEYDAMIIIDATLSQKKQDQIKVLKPKYSTDFPPTLSAHSLGLKDMIDSAILIQNLPNVYLITVPIETPQNMEMKLSEKLEARIPEIIKAVKTILTNLSISTKN